MSKREADQAVNRLFRRQLAVAKETVELFKNGQQDLPRLLPRVRGGTVRNATRREDKSFEAQFDL